MIPLPPGLTCATCRRPFRKALAHPTPEGYVHTTDCLSPVDLTETEGRWVRVGRVQRWVA